MKKVKDNFSRQSDRYAKFRPNYPSSFLDYVCSFLSQRNLAWDCATGNGQLAVPLSKLFVSVVATDISASQIGNAPRKENIDYRHERAENCSLITESVDLITVGQAIHWLDFNAFYLEAKRVLKKDGILAIVGYPLFRIEKPSVDKLVFHFYKHILGEYWDSERRYIDEKYGTLPFPFEEISLPKFEIKYQWGIDALLGYLGSWSAVAHYRAKNSTDPMATMRVKLKNLLSKEEKITVCFDIIGRAGRK